MKAGRAQRGESGGVAVSWAVSCTDSRCSRVSDGSDGSGGSGDSGDSGDSAS